MRTSFVIAGVAGVGLMLSSSALAANYSFSAVDTTGFTYLSTPVMNDSGQVAFIGQRADDATKGYFIGTAAGGSPVRVSTTDADSPNLPQINNAGQIAYTSFYNGGIVDLHRASVAGGDELLEHGIYTNFSGYTYFGNNAMINSAGDVTAVARRYDLVNFTDFRAIVTYSGANNSHSEQVTSGGPYATFTENYPTFSTNDNGDVAFTAQLSGGGQGVFLKRNGTVTTILNDPTNAYGFINEVRLNNQGHALIFAESNNHPAMFEYDGTSLKPYLVADGASGFSGMTWSDFNDHDQAAFMAGQHYSNEGIWIGTDVANDKVIKMGDTLLGATVTYLSLWPGGLNNDGQIAFYAQLNDGRHLLVVGTPVPEPTAVALLAIGWSGTLLRRRRRNCKDFRRQIGGGMV
jgi:hypothetical protein